MQQRAGKKEQVDSSNFYCVRVLEPKFLWETFRILEQSKDLSMINYTILVFSAFLLFGSHFACGQAEAPTQNAHRLVGGSCEGCEAIFEYGKRELNSLDTLPGFFDEGEPLKISGTIYQPDEKTPAEGVILYVYQTNQQGIYENKYQENNWARRHGYIRGWLKTGPDGRFCFFTTMPGTYPNRQEPAHIHPTLLEPDGKYYWLHSIVFAGDPLLGTDQKTSNATQRGNSGLIHLNKNGNQWEGQINFILGKNIPNYH